VKNSVWLILNILCVLMFDIVSLGYCYFLCALLRIKILIDIDIEDID